MQRFEFGAIWKEEAEFVVAEIAKKRVPPLLIVAMGMVRDEEELSKESLRHPQELVGGAFGGAGTAAADNRR